MKKLLNSFACLAFLVANSARGDDLPFFSSLREEISSQLTIATNTLPVDKKLAAVLRSSLKIVDKTKPTLIAGSGALGTLAKSLGKTSLSNTFLPIVVDTRQTYLEVIDSEKTALEGRLAETIPGKAKSSAQTAIDKLAAAIEAVETNASLTLSLKSLSTAAKALATADKKVAKAETAKPGADFLTATITESNQAGTIFKPAKKTILEAYYDEFSGEIEIDAGELKKLAGGRVQVRFLEITAAVPGEGTHTLSLTNEAYAIYQRAVAPNIREFEEEEPEFEFDELFFTIDPINQSLGTGTVTITVDFEANIVWGTFTFTANGSGNTDLEASMTGSFLLRLSTYEDF
jgi:uncharacterized protein (UPF0218 family)